MECTADTRYTRGLNLVSNCTLGIANLHWWVRRAWLYAIVHHPLHSTHTLTHSTLVYTMFPPSLTDTSSSCPPSLPSFLPSQVEAHRRTTLASLPPVLILHLKRFLYNTSGGGLQKLMKPVEYSADLEISKGNTI